MSTTFFIPVLQSIHRWNQVKEAFANKEKMPVIFEKAYHAFPHYDDKGKEWVGYEVVLAPVKNVEAPTKAVGDYVVFADKKAVLLTNPLVALMFEDLTVAVVPLSAVTEIYRAIHAPIIPYELFEAARNRVEKSILKMFLGD